MPADRQSNIGIRRHLELGLRLPGAKLPGSGCDQHLQQHRRVAQYRVEPNCLLFRPPRPVGVGRYRVEAGEEDAPYANTIEFQVADTTPEMADTDMQIERLQRIAELSGGKSLRLSEVQELATSLNRTRRHAVIRREQSLWDNGLFALLVIALTGFEWIVRRRCDLL